LKTTLTVDESRWPGEYAVFFRRDPLHDTLLSIVVSATGVDLGVLKEVHTRMLKEGDSCLVEINELRDDERVRAPCILSSYTSFITEITGWSYRVEFSVRPKTADRRDGVSP